MGQADPNIKVGSGYIEVSPKLTGFNRELTREIKRRLKATGALEATISPVLDKRFASKLKKQIDQELKSLGGIEIVVTAKLDTSALDAYAAAHKKVVDEQKKTSDAATKRERKAAQELSRSYSDAIYNLRRAFLLLGDDIASGLVNIKDPEVIETLKRLEQGLSDLHAKRAELTNQQLSSVRSGLNDIIRMFTRVSKANAEDLKKQQSAWDEHLTRLRNKLRETEIQVRTGYRSFKDPDVLRFVNQLRQEYARLSKDSGNLTLGRLTNLRGSVGELERFSSLIEKEMKQAGQKGASSFGSAFSGGLAGAIATTVRFMVARFAVIFTTILAMAPLAANAISTLGAIVTALGSSAAYAAGSLAALPAVFALVAQGAAALLAGFWGIQEALSSLLKADDKSGAAAEASAAAREAAAERVQAAQERLADAQESATERVQSAQRRLAEVQEQAAERVLSAQEAITDAQERLADVQERALERVADAQERITDAQLRLTDVQEQAARRVEDAQKRVVDAQEQAASRVTSAEKRLQDAHRRSADALKDLNRAREEARERLEDLRLEMEGGVLDEEAARQAIEQAARELDYANNNPNATAEQRREAELKHRQALQRLKEIQEKNGDLAEELEKVNRDGIDGTSQVIDAKERLKDAQEAELDAERELAETRQEGVEAVHDAELALADARKEAARSVADAQADILRAERDLDKARRDSAREVQDALEAITDAEANLVKVRQDSTRDVAEAEAEIARARVEGAKDVQRAQRDLSRALEDQGDALEKQSIQAKNAEVALSKLSPAGRAFVYFLRDEVIPELKRVQFAVQEAFLPGLQTGIRLALPLLRIFERELGVTGSIAGDLAIRLGEMLSSDAWQTDITTVMQSNNRALQSLGNAGLYAADAARHLVVAAGPLIEWAAQGIERFARLAAVWLENKRQTGELAIFFDRVKQTLSTLIAIAFNVAVALGNVFQLGQPHGQTMLETVEKLTAKFAEWTGSTEGQNKIQEWFRQGMEVAQQLWLLLQDLGTLFLTLSSDGSFAGLIETVRGILPVLELIATHFEKILLLAGSLALIKFGAGIISSAGEAAQGMSRLGDALGIVDTKSRSAKSGLDEVDGASRRASSGMNDADSKSGKLGSALGGLFGVMRAHPIGLLVTAIGGALIGALTAAYNHNENFRSAWDDAWAEIEGIIAEFWKACQPIFEDLAHWLRESVIPMLKSFAKWFREDGGPALQWFWEHIAKPVLTNLGHWFSVIFNGIGLALDVFTGNWEGAWSKVKNIFASILNVISNQWNNTMAPIIEGIGSWFGASWTLPRIPPMPHFADGGILPGYRPGKDTVPAMLSPGEAVLRPEVVRFLGADTINSLNAAAKSGRLNGRRGGIAGFASGGIVQAADGWDGILSAFGSGMGIGGIVTMVRDYIIRPFIDAVLGSGNTGVNGVIRGIALTLMDAVTGWAQRPMATGGLVTRPTRALIGEAGPELVLPLSDPRRTAALLTSAGLVGGTGRVYNVTLNAAPTIPTERQLVNTLSYVDALYA